MVCARIATIVTSMVMMPFALMERIFKSPRHHYKFSAQNSFHSRVKMNSTNWPVPNAWVFIAQLVRAMQC